MNLWTRRLVLQRAMQLSALGVATPLAINLAAIGEAAAFEATDYKALVCVFLYGGNDYANTVVPYDPANYAKYHEIRAGTAGEDEAGIALARADLAAKIAQGSTAIVEAPVVDAPRRVVQV